MPRDDGVGVPALGEIEPEKLVVRRGKDSWLVHGDPNGHHATRWRRCFWLLYWTGSPGQADLAEQHHRLEETFGHGWVTPARVPLIFYETQLARIEQVRDHGGWLNREEHEYLQRLRMGGRRGDPLPAAPAIREPFIDGLAEDFELRTVGADDGAHVVLLFSVEHWPGVRFGHRFPPPHEADGHEEVWLKEEIETGALARQIGRHPPPDDDGIIWTDWGWTPSR